MPSVGSPSGSFGLGDFGAFLGSFDDIRVYDRGLSANEISQVFAEMPTKAGLVEYRVVEKPQINTLPAMEARPQSVILRRNLASIGGEIIEEEISLGETFKYDTIPEFRHGLMPNKLLDRMEHPLVVGRINRPDQIRIVVLIM